VEAVNPQAMGFALRHPVEGRSRYRGEVPRTARTIPRFQSFLFGVV